MAGMDRGTSSRPGVQAVCIVIAALLLMTTLAECRPVASGWNLSQSAGSSDRRLWRKFATDAQAVGYHRTLLALEKIREKQENLAKNTVKRSLGEQVNFNNMDYADPRNNKPGSSDTMTPPSP